MAHNLGLIHHKKNLKEKSKKFFDKAIYFVAIIGPLFILPQTIKILTSQDASSISIWTFIGFVIVSFFWVTYGVIHKEKPIIYTNILYAILHFSVVLSAIIYG